MLEKVLDQKVIAIVRGQEPSEMESLAIALSAGGIALMEITFSQKEPEKWKDTCASIRMLADRFAGRIEPGAGTVATLDQLHLAADAGAKYVISPNTNPEIIREAKRLGLLAMPGAMTPSEILLAHESGADFVKVFPAGALGTSYVMAVKAPLNHVRLLAVGGVNEKNAADFIAAGCVDVGVGGNLVSKEWIKAGRWADIEALAAEYVRAVRT
jgi:2-dehydro-3-deoxyphosphogluconate aldolase/(4S)-4-hydroxy-2-oxoglutarate aldolase